MNDLVIALIFLALALVGVVVRKTYYHLPVKELKRRAGRHNKVATKLYGAVAYGSSLRGLLWVFIGLTTALSVVLLSRSLPVWASILIVGPLLWVGFSYIPATKTTSIGMQLTLFVTPAIVWLLNYLHPLLSKGTKSFEKHLDKAAHTKLFERDDLLDLIDKAKKQHDSRFSTEELDIAKRALQFGDYKVADVLQPAKQVKIIDSMEHIGPVVIDEIYKSGQKFVLAREGKKGPFAGVLEADSLGLHTQGLAHNLMRPVVYYLHEDDSLSEALKAFFKTNFPVFVVINEHEEFVGIVSIDEIIQKLVGHVPGEDFDEYANPSMVASRHSRTEQGSISFEQTDVDDLEKPKTNSNKHDEIVIEDDNASE